MTAEQSPLNSVSGARLCLLPKTSFAPLLRLCQTEPVLCTGLRFGIAWEQSKVRSTPFPAPGFAFCRKLLSLPCSAFAKPNPCFALGFGLGLRGNRTKSAQLRFRRQALPSAENFFCSLAPPLPNRTRALHWASVWDCVGTEQSPLPPL